MARVDWNRFDWSSLGSGWTKDIRVATSFFTSLPVRTDGEITGEELGHALRAWPLVGIGVGLAGGLGLVVAQELGLGPLIAAFVALAITTAATGAFHEDGLADLADGLGGRDATERLAIMRDSRLGTFGMLALFFCVGLRVAALAQLATPAAAVAALVAAAGASRGLVPLIVLWLVPARPDGLGAMLGRPSQEIIVTAAVLAVLVALILLGLAGGITALACGLAALLGVGALAQKRLGGYTGDVLGAAQQVTETAVLLAAVIAA